jgi:ABC-type lipoprotein export system ATPase subunit
MGDKHIIDVAGVSKGYAIDGQPLSAVNDVSFSVRKGEMVAVVGHSGSGKTTLLSLIGGLTKPDSGRVLIEDVDIWTLSDGSLSEFRSRKMNFIYQFSSLIPTLTALENIVLPSVFWKRPEGVGDYAMELLETVGLKDKANSYPSQLSGGQNRRVAIARAFVNRPDIILADEPTGDLDEETEREVVALFKRMNKDKGTTFLIVTHNTDLARQTDRQMRMRDGVLTAA